MTTQRPPSGADSGRLGFLSKAGLEQLTWETVDREVVLARLVKVVPPGKALRKYETTDGGRERVKAELTQDEKIYSGARALAVQALHTLVEGGRAEWVELEDAKKGKGIRLRERRADVAAAKEAGEPCPACHRPFTAAPQKAGPKSKTTYGTVIEFPLERVRALRDERMTR